MKTVNESSTLMLNAVRSSFTRNGNMLLHLHFSKFMFRRQHGGWLPVTCVQMIVYSLARVVLAIVPSSIPHCFK